MRRLVLASFALIAVIAALAGCSAKGTLRPNVPPEAFIFVQGPVDTVNHNVHLYWYGTDPDGEVVGYEYRLLDPTTPADSAWVSVAATVTDQVMSISTPSGYAAPTFEVRAIDNGGLKTQPPARQSFQFSNLPPTVTFTNRFRLADTTFASATPTWAATDPDGDGTKLRFRLWLDGNAAAPNVVSGSSFTLPSDGFLQAGAYRAGYRTMYIQAIDDGGMLSTIDSTTWYVRAPATGGHSHPGRLLIIDDVPTEFPLNYSTDTLYTNTAARNLAAGQYSVLQLRYTQPFRSTKDLEQTFKLFDAVIWYIGGTQNFATFETTLQSYQDAIGPYVSSGGNLYLEGTNLLSALHATGPLRSTFLTERLGSDFLFQWWHSAGTPTEGFIDSTAGWGNTNPSYFGTAWGDTLRAGSVPTIIGSTGGLRAFGIRDNSYGLLWAAPPPYRSLSPTSLTIPVPVAVSVPQAGGGRLIMVTLPLRAASSAPAPYNVVPRFLAHVFQQMGLTGS
jgi:hypothetical protein